MTEDDNFQPPETVPSKNTSANEVDFWHDLDIAPRTLPEGFIPGRPYTTPSKLIESGLIHYDRSYIARLVRSGLLPGSAMIERRAIIFAEGVTLLLKMQKESVIMPLPAGSRLKRK